MKILIIRKSALFKKEYHQIFESDDIEITILYAKRAGKKIKALCKEYDFVFSDVFKAFNKTKPNLMRLFPEKTLEKIISRHGLNSDNEPLGVYVENLSNENKEILNKLALNVRFMTIYTLLSQENFDFLCEEAGISPEIVKNSNFKQKIVACLGGEFLIKHIPSGKTYYDIKLKLPPKLEEYCLPEQHIIFSEYIRANPSSWQNVKISELMSK